MTPSELSLRGPIGALLLGFIASTFGALGMLPESAPGTLAPALLVVGLPSVGFGIFGWRVRRFLPRVRPAGLNVEGVGVFYSLAR